MCGELDMRQVSTRNKYQDQSFKNKNAQGTY